MTRTVLAIAVGFMAGSVATIVVAYSMGKAEHNGALHDHPFIKVSAWASSKIATGTKHHIRHLAEAKRI